MAAALFDSPMYDHGDSDADLVDVSYAPFFYREGAQDALEGVWKPPAREVGWGDEAYRAYLDGWQFGNGRSGEALTVRNPYVLPPERPFLLRSNPSHRSSTRTKYDGLYSELLIEHSRKAPGPKLNGPAAVVEFVHGEYPNLKVSAHEHFILVAVDIKLRVVGYATISKGALGSTAVDIAQVMRYATLLPAHGIFVTHNHPSQLPDPSPEDLELTRVIQRACATVGIRFIDSIIIAGDTFTSLQGQV